MTPLTELLQQGSTHAWLYLPSAVLLGALHGLEPGHSKTMMAAFIIAIRGTVLQAVLLGLAATVSHTAVVWAVALTGLYFGGQWDLAAIEPYLQMLSGGIVIAVALWMLLRTRREHLAEQAHSHEHAPGEAHEHHHHGHQHSHGHVHVYAQPNAGLRPIAHSAGQERTFELLAPGYQDAHERAHADDIRRRFGDRPVTTGQIIVFGLTGGLIPCPASITVLVLCLQFKQFTLGVGLVLAFSLGLALTMVSVGALAAVSARQLGSRITQRWSGVGDWVRRAPYISSALIIGIGIYLFCAGAMALN